MSTKWHVIFWGALVGVFVAVLWAFGDLLAPFILGLIIAYLFNPVMRRLSHKKIPRAVSAFFILGTFILFIAGLVVAFGPGALHQTQALIENAPKFLDKFMDYSKPYLSWFKKNTGQDPIEHINDLINPAPSPQSSEASGGGLIGGIAMGGRMVVNLVTLVVLTPIVAFFMLKEWPNVVKWVEDLYPRQYEHLIRGLLRKIDKKVSGFIRGQITVAFFLGVFYSIALAIADLNYGFLIGLGTGIFSVVPLVGSTLGLAIGISVAWFQTGDINFVLIVAAIFAFGQFVEGNILTPKIVGNSVGLHPLWIMFAILVGGGLFGITGMMVAVPMAAVISVLGEFALDKYKTSPLYKVPESVPPESTIILEDTPLD